MQMPWHEYVTQVMAGDRQVEAARKTGVDQTTISRWLNPETDHTRRTSQTVRAFALGYDRPVLEAFVIAGFLSEEEAGMKAWKPMLDIQDIPRDALMKEVSRRMA